MKSSLRVNKYLAIYHPDWDRPQIEKKRGKLVKDE